MRLRSTLTLLLLVVASAALVFQFFQRRLSEVAFAFGVHPDVLTALSSSLDDQKLLAGMDPDHSVVYRERFERIETTLHRLQILEHSRAEMMERYDIVLLVVVGVIALLIGTVYVVRQRRMEPRLERLQSALSDLAAGHLDIEIGDRSRDTIGRIASMVERTSHVMARDRRRLAALDNLSAWQEAARRHAHEMRTPLTGARLELTRLDDLLAADGTPEDSEPRRAVSGAIEELGRLRAFADGFTSFARLPRPVLETRDLVELLGAFVNTYDGAWDNLAFELAATGGVSARVDRSMIRQVLVNLCDNSSAAFGEGAGTVAVEVRAGGGRAVIRVSDDGPGVDPEVRTRLFEPYSTTRSIGEGMGLGLAISKKIMLDHGGDLELEDSSTEGTVFLITLPLEEAV